MRQALLIALALSGCARERGFQKCAPPPSGISLATALEQYPLLSQYCLVDSDAGGKLIAHPEATRYELTSALFSDYAQKIRTIWMPKGAQARFVASDTLDFPVGTIITKTFVFPKDYRMPEKDVRLVETRLLIRDGSGWIALPYIWNEAQTEALLTVEGGARPQAWTDEQGQGAQAGYQVPTQTQCGQCHESNKVVHPIGTKARWMNRAGVSGNGNQIDELAASGELSGAPASAMAERQPAWDDASAGTVAERARAYLEINCGHCHSPDGLGRTTGLTLTAAESDPMKLGVCKRPVAAGEASNGLSYDIVPGKPDESILVFRMESTKPSIMMPEIGRSVQHREAVALVREWIKGMAGGCP